MLRRFDWVPLAQQVSLLSHRLYLAGGPQHALLRLQLVPLQRDILFTNQLSWSSTLHMSAAAVFFLGSTVHMIAWLAMVCAAAPPSSSIHFRVAWRSFCFKLCCCGGSLLPLPTSFLYHPASPLARGRQASLIDKGGLQQYAVVAFVSLFLASFAAELHTLGRARVSLRRNV